MNKKEDNTRKIDMNLPNKLTILRILLVPVIIIVYALGSSYRVLWEKAFILPNLSIANFIILIIFLIAAYTDHLDGAIARKHNMVTNFGKFADPIADKLLVITVFIILLQQNNHNHVLGGDKTVANIFEWWMLIVIVAREFIVTGVRLLAAGDKKVIAASKLGKAKTVAQYVTIALILIGCAVTKQNDELVMLSTWYVIVCKVAIYVMLIMTLLSGIDYVTKNKEVFFDDKKKGKNNN